MKRLKKIALFFIATIFASSIIIWILEITIEGPKHLAAFKNLSATEIKKIMIYNDDNPKKKIFIDTPELLNGFCNSIEPLNKWRGSISRFTHAFPVTIYRKDQELLNLTFFLKYPPDSMLHIDGEKTWGPGSINLYSVTSKPLYLWFKKNAILEKIK